MRPIVTVVVFWYTGTMRASNKSSPKAWVVSVDMGYGHQRPAHSLHHLAAGGSVVVANAYPGIPARDRLIWDKSQSFYEFISRFKNIPLVGEWAFSVYDRFQAIPQFYPRRDLSKPNVQLTQIYRLIKRRQWGRHLITQLAREPRPLIATFFAIAFMADEFSYPGEIYCLVTDTDISRTWVPLRPTASRINYFAPNYRVVERLKRYGVSGDRIFLTGFPLPPANTGSLSLGTLRRDVAYRLVNLDPQRLYQSRYNDIITKYLQVKQLPRRGNHPLTLMFSVGGAGAQREIGATIVSSLKREITDGRIRLVLIAGIHNSLSTYFRDCVRHCGLSKTLGRGVEIVFARSKEAYFDAFNRALRTTDILWTKPSELSFYCALGIPIVLAPPIGSQEVFNRTWLRTVGAAASQNPPEYTNEWLFDWVESGWLAEAAMQGFVEAPKFGTHNIEKIIQKKPTEARKVQMVLQY